MSKIEIGTMWIGLKVYTYIIGIPEEYDKKKILKTWKKSLHTGGWVKNYDGTEGIVLRGSHCAFVDKFLIDTGIKDDSDDDLSPKIQ